MNGSWRSWSKCSVGLTLFPAIVTMSGGCGASQPTCEVDMPLPCDIRLGECQTSLAALLACHSGHADVGPPPVEFAALASADVNSARAEYAPVASALRTLELYRPEVGVEAFDGYGEFDETRPGLTMYFDDGFGTQGANYLYTQLSVVYRQYVDVGLMRPPLEEIDRSLAIGAVSHAEATFWADLVHASILNVPFAAYDRPFAFPEPREVLRRSPSAMTDSLSALAELSGYPYIRSRWDLEGATAIRAVIMEPPTHTGVLLGQLDVAEASEAPIPTPTLGDALSGFELEGARSLGRWNLQVFVERLFNQVRMAPASRQEVVDLTEAWRRDRLFSYTSSTSDDSGFVWVHDWETPASGEVVGPPEVRGMVLVAGLADGRSWDAIDVQGRLVVYGSSNEAKLATWGSVARDVSNH